MSPEVGIELRLAAVEAAVEELRHRVPPPNGPTSWLARLIGSQAMEPAFDEVVALGAEFRRASPPPEGNAT